MWQPLHKQLEAAYFDGRKIPEFNVEKLSHAEHKKENQFSSQNNIKNEIFYL